MSRQRHCVDCPRCRRTFAPYSADVADLIARDGCGQCATGWKPKQQRTEGGRVAPPRTFYDEYHGIGKGEP